MPMVDTDVFLLHVDKYEVGDSTPGCMSHRFIRAVFMQRWADPWSILATLGVAPVNVRGMDLGSAADGAVGLLWFWMCLVANGPNISRLVLCRIKFS